MNAAPGPANGFFVGGGTLKPAAPSYVERAADGEFLAHLSAGDFCYVLTSRQMGKSSLMARTAVRLRESGVLTAVIDLTSIGEGGDRNQVAAASAWYYGIARATARELGLNTDIKHWWQERDGLPEQQRFTEFLEEIVLGGTTQGVVILVDEIDSTLRLPFTDDFFAGIRACYNARATKPVFARLTFALLGVASPTELIKDTARTPFNVGHRIELNDFTPAEAQGLTAGLPLPRAAAARALERVLHWTAGHPYLTQRLCLELSRRLAREPAPDDPVQGVDALVQALFLSSAGSRDEVHFKYIRDRVRQDPHSRQVLLTYRCVFRGERVTDNPQSVVHNALKLAGLVRRNAEGWLVGRNRIYERVFSLDWVRQAMPVNVWKRTAIAASSVLVGCVALWFWWIEPLQRSRQDIRNYSAQIEGAQEDVPRLAYEQLRQIPGQQQLADRLLADYWHRRGLELERLAEQLAGGESTKASSLLELQSQIGRLAHQLEGDEVASVVARTADRLVAALENPRKTDAKLLSALTGALNAVADRLEPKDAAGLAERLAERLVKALERPAEPDGRRGGDADRVERLRSGLVALVGRMQPNDAARLAERLTQALEHPADTDAECLASLGRGLEALARRMEPHAAARARSRGAALLTDGLEEWQHADSQSQSKLGEALAALVTDLEPKEAARLAARSATILAEILAVDEFDNHPFPSLGNSLAALATRLDPTDAAAVAQRLAGTLAIPRVTDAGRLASFEKVLVALSVRMLPQDCAVVARRVVAAFNHEIRPDRLATLGAVLSALAAHMEPKPAAEVAAPAAAALAEAIERLERIPNTEPSDYLVRMGDPLASLAARMEPRAAAELVARAAAVVARAMESAPESGQDRLLERGRTLAVLAARMEPKAAADVAARGATAIARAMEASRGSRAAETLVHLASTLASLAAYFEPKPSAESVARGAAVLGRNLETLEPGDLSEATFLAIGLATLASSLEPIEASALTGRAALRLTQALENHARSADPEELTGLGLGISLVATRMEPAEATEAVTRAAAVLNDLGSIPERVPSDLSFLLGFTLASLAARLSGDAADPTGARAAALLTKDVDPRQGTDRTALTDLAQGMETMAEDIGDKAKELIVRDWVQSVERLQSSQPGSRQKLERLLELLRRNLPGPP